MKVIAVALFFVCFGLIAAIIIFAIFQIFFNVILNPINDALPNVTPLKRAIRVLPSVHSLPRLSRHRSRSGRKHGDDREIDEETGRPAP